MKEQDKSKPELLRYDIEVREPWLSIQPAGWIALVLLAVIAAICIGSIF